LAAIRLRDAAQVRTRVIANEANPLTQHIASFARPSWRTRWVPRPAVTTPSGGGRAS